MGEVLISKGSTLDLQKLFWAIWGVQQYLKGRGRFGPTKPWMKRDWFQTLAKKKDLLKQEVNLNSLRFSLKPLDSKSQSSSLETLVGSLRISRIVGLGHCSWQAPGFRVHPETVNPNPKPQTLNPKP